MNGYWNILGFLGNVLQLRCCCECSSEDLTVQEIYKDRKKFSKAVFEVASSDLVNMGISVVSYTLKDLKDDEVRCWDWIIIFIYF